MEDIGLGIGDVIWNVHDGCKYKVMYERDGYYYAGYMLGSDSQLKSIYGRDMFAFNRTWAKSRVEMHEKQIEMFECRIEDIRRIMEEENGSVS